jgi:PAS domain S-box-containing protein
MNLEAALVDVSHLLVSSNRVDLREVLKAICEAVEADSAYLVTSAWHPPSSIPDTTTEIVFWHRDGHPPPSDLLVSNLLDGDYRHANRGTDHQTAHPGKPAGTFFIHSDSDQGIIKGIVIPVLSQDDQFVGYLGIALSESSEARLNEQSRILSIFGDLLASYYSRVLAEQALRESEERWRKLVGRHPDPILITDENDKILYGNRAASTLLGLDDGARLEQFNFTDFLDAEQYEEVTRLQRQQLEQKHHQTIEHEVTRLDGEERIVESLTTVVSFRGKPAHQLVLRDITERRATEERYRTFVRTIAEGIFRIDLVRPIAIHADPELQLRHIQQYGVLAESNQMMLDFMTSLGIGDVTGRSVGTAFPFLPDTVYETFVRANYRLEGFEFSSQRPGHESRHFAVNAVGRIEHGFLRRIWGSCIDISARVEMERRMVAVLEEQQERIGRDLHDGVGQLLTGIRMLTANLAGRLEQDGASPATETARKVSRFAEEASQRVREICRGLSPPQISQEELAYSLDALVTYTQSICEAECTFSWDGIAEVPDREAKVQLYRIAQEAINNTLKHAEASTVRVSLTTEREFIILEIEDNGIGFDQDAMFAQSIGLYSMHRRANSMRAVLSIESAPGEGTRVRVAYRALPDPA